MGITRLCPPKDTDVIAISFGMTRFVCHETPSPESLTER